MSVLFRYSNNKLGYILCMISYFPFSSQVSRLSCTLCSRGQDLESKMAPSVLKVFSETSSHEKQVNYAATLTLDRILSPCFFFLFFLKDKKTFFFIFYFSNLFKPDCCPSLVMMMMMTSRWNTLWKSSSLWMKTSVELKNS